MCISGLSKSKISMKSHWECNVGFCKKGVVHLRWNRGSKRSDSTNELILEKTLEEL
jgi:hypothetical protein